MLQVQDSSRLASVDESPVINREAVRPFLKWAGGKKRLLPELLKRVPEGFDRYVEPFLGGGALFFALQPEKALLSDINAEIVNAFQVVRDDVEALIADLSKHRYGEKYYYKIRNADRGADFWTYSEVEKASRVIYLNKTCYNGLYRVNSRGEFNVPFGDYDKPSIVDEENLRRCSRVLQFAELKCQNFLEMEDSFKAGDFVYFDPPYVPLSKTANFTAYSAGGFSTQQQHELALLCEQLHHRGVKFLLSNSCSELVAELYSGFKIETIHSSRAINSKADSRGKVPEFLVRNY